ncbi:DUF1080 domain-containing protein [Aliifodinibius salicampi]|uniref:DUF1080 domain-containing protein n=1 Tax=Fodinibius salicampi TaxID=1920655 RepID=A0ABT3PVJ3_9BACT|nr:DUF1080 domain-containing protein [Fodinibius salicampi]MCW9711880.1 DUF1080 domain-containing protein [Fodinibius salicampi]
MLNRTIFTVTAFIIFTIFISVSVSCAQEQEMQPEDTEVWEPVPPKVDPGSFTKLPPPSDAVVLFDGANFDQWEHTDGGGKPEWKIEDDHMTVVAGTGSIQTKKDFGSVQLHIEWRSPEKIEGEGQGRGNSGVFFQNRYEVQVLDAYENETYVNGMAGSIYKQHIPEANVARKPGEWQSYDIVFIAPEFSDDGSLESPARVTVFWNGVLVQHDVELEGPTEYIGHPSYEAHGEAPITLQDHSNPVSFRNVWVRELDK